MHMSAMEPDEIDRLTVERYEAVGASGTKEEIAVIKMEDKYRLACKQYEEVFDVTWDNLDDAVRTLTNNVEMYGGFITKL
jgi:hypothetical protein